MILNRFMKNPLLKSLESPVEANDTTLYTQLEMRYGPAIAQGIMDKVDTDYLPQKLRVEIANDNQGGPSNDNTVIGQ